MKLLKIYKETLNSWWQPPRLSDAAVVNREVSFLKLFYDLIFVWIFAQLGHAFVYDVTFASFISFLGLFALVWFAWVNGSYYHELHGNEDIRTRFFVFLQMFTLTGVAISIADTLAAGPGTTMFLLSYIAFLCTMTFQWWRVGVFHATHRPLTIPYVSGFVVAIVLLAASLFVSGQLQVVLWGVATVSMLVLPMFVQRLKSVQTAENVTETMRVRPALVERFGLFTIIVIGEVMNSVVSGGSHAVPLEWEEMNMIACSFFIVAFFWLIFNDFVARRIPEQTTGDRLWWMYMHLPMTLAIALMSIGILNVFSVHGHFGTLDKWLLTGPAALFLVSVIFLTTALKPRPVNQELYAAAARVVMLSATVLVLVSLLHLSMWQTIIAVMLALFVPMMAGFNLQVRRQYNLQQEGE